MKKDFQIGPNESLNTENNSLLLRLGPNRITFAIWEASNNELKKLVNYSVNGLEIFHVEEWREAEVVLSQKFAKTFLCYDIPKFILSPSQNVNPVSLSTVVQGVDDSYTRITDTLEAGQLLNSYWVPTTLNEWVKDIFHPNRISHQASIQLLQQQQDFGKDRISVEVNTSNFFVTAKKDGHLQIAQYYPYQNQADVLYYLLKICHQFHFSQTSVSVELTGLINQDSSLYKELALYFTSISFRDATWVNDDTELPLHYFTSLNDLAVCV